jgi:hypothetical protein
VKFQKIIKERTPIKVANTVAFFFDIWPVTTGRFAVRAINLSRSLSITMLNALALPAARVPAKIVAKANPNSGNPLAAKTMAGNVDTSKSSTTLNFIRSRYPRIVLLTRQDYPAFRSTPPRPLTGTIVTLLSTETADEQEKGRAMTENNKPEWFEITDADEKPELRKVSKSLPVSAVLVAALILGVGAFTAQTQGVTPLSASNTNATQSAQPENNPTAQAVSAVNSAVANPTTVAAAVVGTVATNKLANPAISKLPTGGDDEDDDDHGRGHDDDDDDDEGDDD